MKFEFDHRTGMMRPKKDEEIYFAQSQGGGLIVDDKKNDIKYIIERDERITKLFGSFDKDNLNLYDMRDARMIADRVRRLLGVDNKYTDFHYFLRGYHMNESFIKSCSDFLGESIWSDIQDRSGGESVRKEDEIDNLSQDDLCDYLKSKYKPSNQNTDIEFDKKYNIIYVPVCRFAGQAITGVLLEELGTSKRVTSTLSINYFTQPLVDELEKHFQIENVPKIPGKRMALMKISPKDGTEVTNSFFIKVIDFFLNVTVKDYGYDESGQDLKKILKKVNESIWSDIQDRSGGESVRAEDKNVIGVLEDGTKLRVPMDVLNGVGELIKFDDGKNYYTLYDGFYIAVVNEGGDDIYYVYDPDIEDDDVNMVIGPRFNGDSFMTQYEFADLRAVLMSADENNDGVDPSDLCGLTVNARYSNNAVDIELGGGTFDYLVFEDHDDAVSFAVDYEKELFDEIEIDAETITRWRNTLGDDIFDEGELKELFDEYNGSYYDDLDEEDAIDELLRWEVIEDTDEYFDLDEDGEVDHSLPKFDYQDYRDKYVEKRLDSIDDFVDEYISNFGDEGIEKFIDLDKVAEKCVDIDGPGNSISSYDGAERDVEIDGTTYYIYRRN